MSIEIIRSLNYCYNCYVFFLKLLRHDIKVANISYFIENIFKYLGNSKKISLEMYLEEIVICHRIKT